MKAAVVGLGDMGSGLALNLIKAGFETWGFDIDQKRMTSFSEFGENRQKICSSWAAMSTQPS